MSWEFLWGVLPIVRVALTIAADQHGYGFPVRTIVFLAATFLMNLVQAQDLDAGEGFLLFSTDLSVAIEGLELRREGKVFRFDLVDGLDTGLSYRLVPLPQGEYYFDTAVLRATAGQSIKVFLGDDLTRFTIEAGRINYMGHIVLYRYGLSRYSRNRTNRMSQALQWLSSEHPELPGRYSLHYSGSFPDPFADYVAALKAGAVP